MTELTRNQLIAGQQYTKTDGEDLGKFINLNNKLIRTNFYEQPSIIYSDVFENQTITYDSRVLTKYILAENVGGGAKSRRRQRKSKRKSGTRRQRKSMRRR